MSSDHLTAGWLADDLERIGDADELELILPGRRLPIWVVRVGDELFIRSWRGASGAWYRSVVRSGCARVAAGGIERDVRLDHAAGDTPVIDRAYRSKYGRYGRRYVDAMVAEQARATTLRLTPA